MRFQKCAYQQITDYNLLTALNNSLFPHNRNTFYSIIYRFWNSYTVYLIA